MSPPIISNKKINDIIKIVKSLEESGLQIRDFSKTVKNEVKYRKGRFLSMLFSTLGASLLENLLTSKGRIIAGEGTMSASK